MSAARCSWSALLVACLVGSVFGGAAHAQAPVDVAAPEHRRGATEFHPGNGAHFESEDARFVLNLWLRSQLRYTLHDDTASGERQAEHAFEIRRASLFLAGHVYGPHNKYFAQLIFTPREMGLGTPAPQSPIFDWFFTFDHLRDASLHVGQFKPFFSRQFIAPWGALQFVDRSSVELEFLSERDIGFDLHSLDLGGLGVLRYHAGLFAGEGRNTYASSDFGLSYVARLELAPFGFFDDMAEADLLRSSSPKLAMGVAYALQDRAKRDHGVSGAVPADGGTTDVQKVTFDAILKYRGLSTQGALFYRHGKRDGGSTVDDAGAMIPVTPSRNAVGGFAQAGYLLPGLPLELAARYGRTHFESATGLPDSSELGGAVSYYVDNHNFKLQADYFRLWSDSRFTSGQNQARLQLQVSL